MPATKKGRHQLIDWCLVALVNGAIVLCLLKGTMSSAIALIQVIMMAVGVGIVICSIASTLEKWVDAGKE